MEKGKKIIKARVGKKGIDILTLISPTYKSSKTHFKIIAKGNSLNTKVDGEKIEKLPMMKKNREIFDEMKKRNISEIIINHNVIVKKCPGSKIRSKGKGRGFGVGQGKGPIGRHKK